MLYAKKKIKQCSVFFQDLYSLLFVIYFPSELGEGEGFKIRNFLLSLLLIFVFH